MSNENMQFCSDCGNEYSRRATACPKCGCPSALVTQQTNTITTLYPDQKDRLTYILLGLFLGGLGIHNFYAGESSKGVIKLLLTLLLGWLIVPIFIVGIWALIEICTVKADANGVPFK